MRSKKKKKKKSRRTLNTPRSPQQPVDRDHLETACNETRPRVSPYSPPSIDPGFVEIGLIQLSQSEKTTNVTHTQVNKIMAPCTHPGMKRLFRFIGKNNLITNIFFCHVGKKGHASLLSGEVNERRRPGLILAAGRVRS